MLQIQARGADTEGPVTRMNTYHRAFLTPPAGNIWGNKVRALEVVTAETRKPLQCEWSRECLAHSSAGGVVMPAIAVNRERQPYLPPKPLGRDSGGTTGGLIPPGVWFSYWSRCRWKA